MTRPSSSKDSGAGTDFAGAVFKVVSGIAAGKVMSYKQVAAAAGRPRAWRAVGNILNRNYDKRIPCHRVIRSDGRPGGYNRGRQRKARLLQTEAARRRRGRTSRRNSRPV